MASCGDGEVTPGERCHVALAGLPIGAEPRQIAAGDLDDDGWPDVVAIGPNNEMQVAFGIGDGMLELVEPVALPYSDHIDVALGDVDGDDDLDAVIASSTYGLFITVVWAGGSFGETITSGSMGTPRAIAIGDFEATGGVDVLYTNNGQNARVAVGDGNGTFTREQMFDAPLGADKGRALATGMLDDDGWLDAATVDFGPSPPKLTVLYGAMTGPAMTETFSAQNGTNDVTLADLDGDGVPEIVATNTGADSLTVATPGGPASHFGVADRPWVLAPADFDLDGRLDLAVAHQGADDHLALVWGDGSLAPSEATEFSVGSTPVSLAIADFNGDGVPDVVVASSQSQDLHVVASSP
jgi:hypothetical protein